MKFETLTIENFLAIGSATINLADRGLVLIDGVNNVETSATSNGAGKSTIADALSWVLYGETARGESGDAVVNLDAGKECSVRVQVTDGAEIYRIIRYRKSKLHKNALRVLKITDPRVPASDIDLTKGTEKLTQDVVTQIIGCSVDVFNGAVYAGQERMPDLPGMTDKTLKMLIEEASGATLLETAYVEANKRLQAAKMDLGGRQGACQTAEHHQQGLIQRLNDAKDSENQFEVDRVAQVNALAVAGRSQKKAIETAQAAIAAIGDTAAIKDRIVTLDGLIHHVSAQVAQDRKNDAVVAAAQADVSRKTGALNGAERQLAREKVALDGLDHQVGCPCSSCDRPFTQSDIAPAKALKAAEIADIERNVTDARAALDAAVLQLQNVTAHRDAYRASMTDLSATNAERASLQADLDKIAALERDTASYKAKLAGFVQNIKDRRDAANPWKAEITKLDADKIAAKSAKDTCEEHLQRAIVDAKIADHVAKVFSPAGVRAFLLDEVTPFLNEQTAKYLGHLSDGHISATWTTLVKNAKGELKEKFSIEVENANGGKTFKSISGGEKRKVRVACALALQDLVARRASKPIELFIGDEIDDALDAAGQERLVQILDEKAKERGSVFVISHADLKDWIRNTITVKKDGPRSTIEESVS